MTTNDDKAGREYWESAWSGRSLPPRFDPDAPTLTACVDRTVDRFLRDATDGLDPRATAVVEVGCGASTILPFLAVRHGFRVAGLDYSPEGAAQSRALLARDGVAGEVHVADPFALPEALVGAFDVAWSNGLVEHFADTAGCVRAIAKLVRPGGRVVTMIPNMAGAVGRAQRYLDRAVYDAHVPLDREALAAAHEGAGLQVRRCDYLHSVNFGVVNAARARGVVRRAVQRALVDASRAVWRYESLAGELPAGRRFAPYVGCVAVAPPSDAEPGGEVPVR